MAADLDGAITRVRRWLRDTVPGDLARVVGTGDGVATDDVAAVLDALDAAQRSAAQSAAAAVDAARDLGHVVATERARADGAESTLVAVTDARNAAVLRAAEAERLLGDVVAAGLAECDRLREDLEWTVACRNAIDAMLDEVRAQRDAARADRDAAVARCTALAGAVRREREAEAYHREAVAECERCLSKPRAWWDRAKLEEERAAASLEDARRTLRAALDALLTEGTRSVADEAECDDCGDDMASGYFDPMARCPRHRP